MSLTAVDWGPAPFDYTFIACAWVFGLITLASIARRWRRTSEGGKLLAFIIALVALGVVAEATIGFYAIFFHASWPPFEWRIFAVFGLPVFLVGAYLLVTNRTIRGVPPN